MHYQLRDARQDDVPQLYQFICDLAEYEKALKEVKCSPASLAESLFCENPTGHAMMIELSGVAVGYVIYFYNYSTWEAARGLYLEDLYIDPAYRGQGAGMQTMRRLAAMAIEQACVRFEWSVLDWNAPSIEFYESLSAQAQSEWLGYRLEGEALSKLAG